MGLGQSFRAPPAGMQHGQRLGQGQPIGQVRFFFISRHMGSAQIIQQQVVAPLVCGVGRVVAVDQRRVGDVAVVAGVIGHFRVVEGFDGVGIADVDHLQEEAVRQAARRAGGVVHLEPRVGGPVSAAAVYLKGGHSTAREGAALG